MIPVSDRRPQDLATVRRLVNRGDHLRAWDVATELLTEGSAVLAEADRAELDYLRVLALARSGSTKRAVEEVERWSSEVPPADRRLAEDRAALRARLAKDRALGRMPPDPDLLRSAAAAYAAVHERFGSPYACANAATLLLLAGDTGGAHQFARQVPTSSDEDRAENLVDYWQIVTAAEAALVLGQIDEALALIRRAGPAAGDNIGARASTRRQLRMLLERIGLDPDPALEPLANPGVLHYCGHRVTADDSERFRAETGPRIDEELDRLASEQGLLAAHGSLACGADLMIARRLIERGVELHAVVPFDLAEFTEVSVSTGGTTWLPDLEFCLSGATSVTITSESAYLGDDRLFDYASRCAMGAALNRARRIDSIPIQLAVWDGHQPDVVGGTASDIDLWRAAGARTRVIDASSRRGGGPASPPPLVTRPITAVLFGDVVGISRLRDEELRAFLPAAWGAAASVIDAHGDAVLERNVWGDALFIAFTDVAAAASCALAIQDAISHLDFEAMGLPADLHLRLAVHVAPTLLLDDPVRRVRGHFGRELTRAARIEPRTPPGSVYATSAFAAFLELDPTTDVFAEYVGTITTAKDFETIPMFVLRDGEVNR